MRNTASKIMVDGTSALAVSAEYIYKDRIKPLALRWAPERRAWILPYTQEVWQSLSMTVPGLVPDDAVAAELIDAADQDVEQQAPADVPPMPLQRGITPYRHQQAAYACAVDAFRRGGHGYAYLMEMGTGKSLTAVGTVGRLYLDGKVRRVLVVAPLAVVPVWPREFTDFAGYPVAVTVLEGTCARKAQALADMPRPGWAVQVAVVNYESAWRIQDALLAWKPDLVICDESQRIKDPASKQSRALHVLGDASPYHLILTGTPVTNSPLDFYSQYRFLDRRILGESWYGFKARYAIEGQEINHTTGRRYNRVIGYRDLPDLLRKVHSIAYRVTKRQALDLPAQVDQTLYCDLEPPAARAYRDLAQDSIAELEGLPTVTAQHVITRLLRLSQLCGGYVRTDVDGYEDDPMAGQLVRVSKAKQRLIEETLDDVLAAGGKKVVVFARFRAEIDAICDYVRKQYGDGALRMIHGDVKPQDRGPAVEAFQRDPAVRIFVAQIATAGLGITLTAADTAIYYSLDYSYANYEQSRARIHRIGQRNTCTYIHLLARGTVDEEVLAALQHKGNVADMCVDRWKELLQS